MIADRPGSGWAPLRITSFRRLWLAQFASNVGSWMQTVAAQWVMLSLTSSAVLIGAIPAAASFPVLLLAIPAGALGDLVDRRRLIVASQVVMLAAAAALAALAALSDLTPTLILLLLFALGCGAALSAPTWQTLQPELVPPANRPDAIALGSVNQNLARAIGPAIGGILLAATSAALVFGVNAVSFVVVVIAVAVTAVPARRLTVPREHALDAVRAGARYVEQSPELIALIVRAAAFILPAGAVWALLPLVARTKLHLGATGYGLLLGCVGVGAIVAATFGPTARRRLTPRTLYACAAAVVAVAAALLAVTGSVAVDAVALVAGGSAWIVALGLLGGAYQSEMPPWVKARGMAYYLVAFQGSNAIGGLVFGAVVQATSLSTSLLTIAACLAACILVTWRLALPASVARDLQPGEPAPLPDLGADDEDTGPVLVAVTWPVRESERERFLAQSTVLRRVRRRTGATSWRLYRDLETGGTLVETFLVGSWADHERQHERLYGPELAVLDGLDALLEPSTSRHVQHFVAVRDG